MSASRRATLVAAAFALAATPLHATAAPPTERDGLSGVLRGVPPLVHVDAAAAAGAWDKVKAIPSPSAQLKALRDQALETRVCTDLVDVRALIRDRGAPFGFRDSWRGRSWARPSLARLLLETMRRFRAEYPNRNVAIGDVSQPGCGQLSYGTLVRHVHGDDAEALINRARLVLGRPTVIDVRRDADGDADEDGAFAPASPTETEQVVVGQERDTDGALLLRVVARRLRPLAPPDASDLARLKKDLAHLAKPNLAASNEATLTVGRDGRPAERWVTHFIDAAGGRQLIAITDAPFKRRLDLDHVVELRLSPWYAKKPGAYRGEVRWRRVAFPATPPRWERWRQVYEAGHVSHHGGLDVDLSYVTRDNTRHFAVDPDAMDVDATWRWFELLDATGRELGTPIEMILVDPKIKRHLAAHLPAKVRKSALWNKIVRLADGHDGHHHLRLAATTAKDEAAARRALTPTSGARSERRRGSPAVR